MTNKINDIQWKTDVIKDSVQKIKDLLDQQIAVTVFVGHNDGFIVKDGVIQQNGDTHFVTIVGCDTKGQFFLFTDPWPNGSRMTYKSGIYGDVDSFFMGLLEHTDKLAWARASAGSTGRHKYVVLSGP